MDEKTQAILNALAQQRNAALDQVALLHGEIAVLQAKLKGKEDGPIQPNG